MQYSFKEILVKQRRLELKSVGNSVAKAVFIESANQFSLEDQCTCRTQYRLKYCSKQNVRQIPKADMNSDILLQTAAIFFYRTFIKNRVLTRCMSWLISFVGAN